MAGLFRVAGEPVQRVGGVSPWGWASLVAGFLIVALGAVGVSAETASFVCHSVLFGRVPADPLAMSITEDHGHVVVLDRNLTLTTWRLGEDAPDTAVSLQMIDAVTGPVVLLPEFGAVIMVDRAGRIMKWSLYDGRLLERRDSAEPIACSAVDPASGMIATAHASGMLRIWDLGDPGNPRDLGENYPAVTSLVFLPAAGALAVASASRGIFVLDSLTGARIQTLSRVEDATVADIGWAAYTRSTHNYGGDSARLKATPGGEWMAVVASDRMVTAWELTGGRYQKREKFKDFPGEVWWDGSGRWLASFQVNGKFSMTAPDGGVVWCFEQEPATAPMVTAADSKCEWRVYVTQDRQLCAWRWVRVVPLDRPSEEEVPATIALIRSLRGQDRALPSAAGAESLAVVGFQIRDGGATRIHSDWSADALRGQDERELGWDSLLDANHDGRVSPGERQRLRVIFASRNPSWAARRLMGIGLMLEQRERSLGYPPRRPYGQ
jgi:hypothetical protein